MPAVVCDGAAGVLYVGTARYDCCCWLLLLSVAAGGEIGEEERPPLGDPEDPACSWEGCGGGRGGGSGACGVLVMSVPWPYATVALGDSCGGDDPGAVAPVLAICGGGGGGGGTCAACVAATDDEEEGCGCGGPGG
jgi:hypothetical protein